METQFLFLAYALGFIVLEIVLLVTIRNRYILLISCAIALFVVEGFLLIILRVREYLLAYIIGLLFVDAIILLSIWPFISGTSNPESDETQGLNLVKNKIGPFSFLVGWLLYASSIVGSIVTKRWFKPILYLLLILWLINNVRSCLRTFPDG
jgi:hypothetical protein